jgi:hypothetical protein
LTRETRLPRVSSLPIRRRCSRALGVPTALAARGSWRESENGQRPHGQTNSSSQSRTCRPSERCAAAARRRARSSGRTTRGGTRDEHARCGRPGRARSAPPGAPGSACTARSCSGVLARSFRAAELLRCHTAASTSPDDGVRGAPPPSVSRGRPYPSGLAPGDDWLVTVAHRWALYKRSRRRSHHTRSSGRAIR